MKLIRIFLLLGIIIIAVSWFSNSTIWKKTKALHLPKKETNYTIKAATRKSWSKKQPQQHDLYSKEGLMTMYAS